MDNFKKVGIVLSSSVLSLGMFAAVAGASTPGIEQPERVQIQVASTEITVTKDDLIKRFRELFPDQFSFLTASDFQIGDSHFYPNDDTLRYGLSFSKTINGKQLFGDLSFVGEDLDVEQFYYQPANEADALYPAKVTKDEARKIADDFLQKFFEGEDYQVQDNPYSYFPQQLLTEPIRYSFSFARMENQVAVSDQWIEVSVLGNGDVVNFYKSSTESGKSTFDDVKLIKDKDEMTQKVKDNLSVDLYYQVNRDYQTGNRSVDLVYQPTAKLQGIHATSGKWLTANDYSTDLPEAAKTEKIVANPLPPKQNGITLEEAKKIAEQLLAIQSDKVKLNINSVREEENYNGQAVISVHYMYEYANGGTGTNLEIDKQTGEVIQYNDLKREVLENYEGQSKNENAPISSQAALTQAVKYLKEWAPSHLHNYAMPLEEPYFEERLGSYHIVFPRIVNGIPVIGDQVMVSIAADGSLNSLNIGYQEVDEWPSHENVISEEKAKTILKDALSLKLTYTKQEQNKADHYELVYTPEFAEQPFSFLDATTGEWNSLFTEASSVTVSHPWAQDELNYLVGAKVLTIKDPKNFDGDAGVSKGEAIKVIMNSLTYFYEDHYLGNQVDKKQTFTNIDSKHPYYSAIERAAELGVISSKDKTFDVDAPITKEELAVWHVRLLGLEQAAKDGNIYKLDFADADKVQKEYVGYVALANSLGLVKTDKNNFKPGQQVTYAELAVSTISLAHEVVKSGKNLRY